MKALLSVAPGGPDSLELHDMPEPVAGPGQVVVAVRACGVNFPDTLIIEDQYQMRPERPFAPGGEIAGIVETVGDGVTAWAPGDRVMGIGFFGGMSEKAVLNEGDLLAMPPERSFVEAAGLVFTYATALYALQHRGELRAGQGLLVLGAAGGVGLASIEIGKALGARVVAAVSSHAKAEAARAANADATLIYPQGGLDRDQSKALASQFKLAAGGVGFDVICDPVGGDYADPAIRSIAWGGRYLVLGFPAGIPKMPLNLALLKGCDIRGVAWGTFRGREPKAQPQLAETLCRWWSEGRITPRITETYPLERGAEAIGRLAQRAAVGKIVVTIGENRAGGR